MKIQISKKMNLFNGIEDYIIRIPLNVRKQFNLSLGEFIILGDKLTLQVDKVFKDDLNTDIVFVTENTFNKLKNLNIIITPIKDITMGCDPEFFIINSKTNNLINPAKFFKKWNSIGYDGMLGELRPAPSTEVDEVATNLFNMINTTKQTFIYNNLSQLSLFAASSGFNLMAGFHCHMGLPTKFLNQKYSNNKAIINFVVKALDYHVGVLSIIPEGSTDAHRRCMPFVSYGKVSDYRIDTRTLEYRVPGGILLKTPCFTKGLLSLCKVVTTDALTKASSYIKNKSNVTTEELLNNIYPQIPSIEDLYTLICSNTTNKAQEEVDTIYKYLENMYEFDNNSNNIIQFLQNINKETKSKDIYLNWSGGINE
jgi:hypothetical protein